MLVNGVANKSSALMELIVARKELIMKKVLKILGAVVVGIYLAITSFATLYAVLFTIGMGKHYEMEGKGDAEMFTDAQNGVGHYCDDKRKAETESNVFKMGFH